MNENSVEEIYIWRLCYKIVKIKTLKYMFMHLIKNILILLLLLACSLTSRAQTQTDTTQSKTRFFDKVSTHWLTAYLMSDPDFMQAERADFKSSAFAELYIEGTIVTDEWLFKMLNRITEYRNEQKQTPHILIKVLLKPENEDMTQYSVNLNATASQNIAVNLNTIVGQAISQHLNKKPYSEPADAVEDIEKALEQILQNLKTALGNSLAPNLILRYNNDIYWSGHEITVLANEGNSVELEALDKNLQPIPSAQLTWTNASPFMHKGVIDLTGLNSQQVSVQRKQGRQTDVATVTLRRVNVTENINDLLKLLIVEVLSVKKQEAQDSVVRLKNDSIANAQSISQAIRALESQNFPLEGGETPKALFVEGAQLLPQADEALFDNNAQRVTSFNLLKRRKALREGIRKKVNVVAFANLIVDQPEKVEFLLDGLLRSSGQLVAQLILNQDQNGMRSVARNIVVDYLNRNIETVAGSTFGFAQPAEPPLQLSPNTTNNNSMPVFKPDTYLYLNPMLDFEGKSAFITETNSYLSSLSEPLYVFINYSHDVSTESYLQRAPATRPKGLPDGAHFIALTLVNIPGSTKFQLVGNRTIQLQTESSVKEILNSYLEDDEEGAMYYDKTKMQKFLSTLRANNEKYANTKDPGTGAYLTNNIVTDQDLKDQKVIDFMSTLSIYQFKSPQDPIIDGFIALIEGSKDSEWVKLIEEKPTPVPYDENPIVLARMMEVETETKDKFTLSMNGYSLSNKSITLYARESADNNGVKFTFFNALIAPSGVTNVGDEKNTTNIRKAFDITIHSKNAEAFKSYIKLKGTIEITEEEPESEEIIIDIVRKRSNKYITVSELSIRGTNIKGAALELGKGTDAESKASCTDQKADCYECKRVPAGEFAFDVNTETTQQGQHKYKTLRLLNTKVNGSQRDGILIHMGDALSWTQGCLLAMYDNEIETIIQNESNIVTNIMGFGDEIDVRNASRAFILSIIEFIEEKEKRLGKSVTKKVIIKQDDNEQTLSISTADFDLMQKANRYYYNNKLYDKAVEQFTLFATSLQEKAIQDKLQTKLAEYTATLIATLTNENYKESDVRVWYETQWAELYRVHAANVTLSFMKSETMSKATNFKEALKTNFSTFITETDVLAGLFHNTLTTLLQERVIKYSTNGGDNTGFKAFVPTHYTQELFDKILADTKSKLIEEEVAKMVEVIED